ncbi:MAG TPA: BrnA antitoxin family protein [Bryobacteraceae bacterium]
MSAESIYNKPLTEKQRETLERIAARQAAGDDSGINYSDIPELTAEQLATAIRPNKTLIAVRVDPEVLAWLKSFGPGYSTRVNGILRTVMKQSRAG